MKVLLLAAVLAALSSNALAGAGHDARPQGTPDTAATVVLADASRIGSASLTALNGSSQWTPTRTDAASSDDFSRLPAQADSGALWVVLGAVALGLARPVRRALRRQEQQRRATALASTLGHTPRA